MTAFLVTCAVLGAITLVVAWVVAQEARRAERLDAKFRLLHPSQSRASVIDQPAGEHVRRVGPPPYDWQEHREDDCGT